jgi:predicted ATP-grasp superfamily ATP-dependent carboligase
MQNKGKILVTDGRSLAALAIVRSLGEKGFEVHCGEEFRLNLTSFSKYIKKTWIYPSPESQPEAFIEAIKRFTSEEKFDMIIPVRDAATLLIAKYADDLSKITNIYLADHNLIKILQNKGETLKLAQKCGVPYPQTHFPEDSDLKDIIPTLKTPFLIRARISSGSRGIAYIRSPDEFEQKYESIKNDFGEPIIQEYIQKKTYCTACVLLDHNSDEVASFTYERVKEYPMSGGPTVVGISCKNEEVTGYAISLLKSIGWKGVAEVEFIIDQNGVPKLLEVNPRFWMPLNLAIQSGVDFPYLLYQLAMKNPIIKQKKYTLNMKYRWVIPNEILWVLSSPNKKQGFKELLTFKGKNICYGELSWKDPLPVFGVLAQALHFLSDKRQRQSFLNRGW